MKLSCLPVSYFREIIDGRMSIKDWALEGARTGLDGIDLSVLFLKNRKPEYLDRTRQEIEEAGIRVAMVTTYPDFTHPDPKERERQLLRLQEDVATASRLGLEMSNLPFAAALSFLLLLAVTILSQPLVRQLVKGFK